MALDSIDQKLLNLVQAEFPLTREPYADIGQKLGIDGEEVICRLKQLKARGIIRQIGPVFDARRLGYQSTLVAMRIRETELDRVEQIISRHPGVSHGYERDHYFNLWFTLAVSPRVDIETELARLTSSFDTEAVFSLPAVKIFKIGAYFNMGEDIQRTQNSSIYSSGTLPEKADLSQPDRLIIRELQQDLPLVPMPFSDMAAQLGVAMEDFLVQCQSLQQRGIMRRFGASINHHQAGFKANAMVCWLVPPEEVDAAGRKLASMPEVSHCYQRETNPLWQYNLFAVIHSHTREACQEVVADISRQIGLKDCILLFSTREFKKTRVKYIV